MTFLRPGLIVGVDQNATGKTPEAVTRSRAERDELVLMFGARSLPSSIMVRTGTDKVQDLDEEARGSYKATQGTAGSKEMHKLVPTTAISSSGVAYGALSVFPQNIGRSMLLFYTQPGDLVIDPFAGHNSRMQLCVKEGRHYTGYDVSKRFLAFNWKRAAWLQQTFPSARINIYEQDSRQLKHTRSSCGDFTITSPPYWDIEEYGDEPEQLGKHAKTYDHFMEGIEQVLRENVRVLKPGAFSCWFINDFRRKGRMYFYHVDVLQAGERAGFVAHDIAIVDFGTGLRDIFINQAYEQKILPKRHEYCVVFRKPT